MKNLKIEESLGKLKVYSYRIDMPHTDNNETKLVEFMKKHPDCKYYIFSREHGDKTEKEHYQGCLFLEKECNGQAYRNIKTRKWVSQHKNNVGFGVAKDEESLKKYCNNKENKGMVTNMPQQLLDTLGKWMPRKQFIEKVLKEKRAKSDTKFKEILTMKIEEMKIELDSYDPNFKKTYINVYEYYQLFADIAYDVYDRLPPMKSLIHLSKGIVEKETFLKLLFRELQHN